MTLLGRAPREVYRVYGEDEFWTSAALDPFDGCSQDERVKASRTPAGRRALLRTAASTVLLASVGAVGGLTAMTGKARSPHDGRGAVAGLFAREGSAYSRIAGTRVWFERTGRPAPRARIARAHRQVWGVIAGVGEERAGHVGAARGLARARGGLASGTPVARPASVIEPGHLGSTVEVAAVGVASRPLAPARVESLAPTAGSPSARRPSAGSAEFGFER